MAYSACCAVKLTSTYPAPRIGKTLEQNTLKGRGSNINDNSGAEQHQRKHAIDAATLKMTAFPFSISSFLFLFPFLFPFFFFSVSLFKLVPANKYENFTENVKQDYRYIKNCVWRSQHIKIFVSIEIPKPVVAHSSQTIEKKGLRGRMHACGAEGCMHAGLLIRADSSGNQPTNQPVGHHASCVISQSCKENLTFTCLNSKNEKRKASASMRPIFNFSAATQSHFRSPTHRDKCGPDISFQLLWS